MFEIILLLICLIIWIITNYGIIKITMNKVLDSTVRYEILVYSFALNNAAFMCGVFLGLLN